LCALGLKRRLTKLLITAAQNYRGSEGNSEEIILPELAVVEMGLYSWFPELLLLMLFFSVPTTAVETTEEECIRAVSISGALSARQHHFTEAMSRGWWQCATIFATSTPQSDIPELLNVFNMEQRAITTKIGSLKSAIESLKPLPTITPALQWAQSTEHILLNVKFAHIISAPATLNVEAKNVSISERGIFLDATDGKKLFRLDLQFSRDIDKDASTYSMASVGRMTFNLKKKDAPSRWRIKGIVKGRGQISTWHDMQESHSKDLEKLPLSSEDGEGQVGGAEEDSIPSLDRKKKKEEDTVEKSSDATEETGKIVTAEEQEKRAAEEERKIAKKSRDEQLKAELEALEKEYRNKKRDVDFDAAERKTKYEAELKVKLQETREKFNKNEEL